MKKNAKASKNSRKDYVYIRLDRDTKKKMKAIALAEGANMTIWARQVIMREVALKSQG